MHRKQRKSWTIKTIHQKLQNNTMKYEDNRAMQSWRTIFKLPAIGEQRPGKKKKTCCTPGIGPYKDLKLSWRHLITPLDSVPIPSPPAQPPKSTDNKRVSLWQKKRMKLHSQVLLSWTLCPLGWVLCSPSLWYIFLHPLSSNKFNFSLFIVWDGYLTCPRYNHVNLSNKFYFFVSIDLGYQFEQVT